MLVSLFFGFVTGNSSVPLAVNLPILSIMDLPINRLYVYLFFVYRSGFIGYYFSPIHLCQILTLQEMGVSTRNLYKEYRLYILILVGLLIFYTLVFSGIYL